MGRIGPMVRARVMEVWTNAEGQNEFLVAESTVLKRMAAAVWRQLLCQLAGPLSRPISLCGRIARLGFRARGATEPSHR